LAFLAITLCRADDQSTQRFLYVGVPGIEAKLERGGQGALVFDIDHDHKFVKRIDSPAGKEKPQNIKGICASATTRRLYETTQIAGPAIGDQFGLGLPSGPPPCCGA
jgi:hypothetical protein